MWKITSNTRIKENWKLTERKTCNKRHPTNNKLKYFNQIVLYMETNTVDASPIISYESSAECWAVPGLQYYQGCQDLIDWVDPWLLKKWIIKKRENESLLPGDL